MEAQFAGVCNCDCGERIHEGDEIEFTSFGWVLKGHPKAEKPAVICGTCYMTRAANGSCGCV